MSLETRHPLMFSLALYLLIPFMNSASDLDFSRNLCILAAYDYAEIGMIANLFLQDNYGFETIQ